MGLPATEALDVYGSIVFAMSFVATFTFIADLGFGMAHMKRVSEGYDLGKCIGTYTTVRLILTGIMVLTIFCSIWAWKYLLGGSFSYAINETVVYMFILYYVLFNIANIAIITYDAKVETAKSQLSALAEPLVRTPFIIVIGISGLIPNELKVYYIAFAYLLGAAGLLIVAMLMFKNYPLKKPDKETFRHYVVFAFPMVVISIISVIVMYADKLIIGYFWSSVEVGQYAGVQAIILNIYFISVAVGYVLFPTMSSHHIKKDITKIRELTYKAERYISMIVTPIAFFIIAFAEEILQLVNAALIPAGNAFRILAVAVIFSSIGTPNGYQVLGLGRTDITIKGNVAQTSIFLIFCLILVPNQLLGIRTMSLGITGAAVAYLIGVICGVFFCKYCSWKLTGTKLQSCLFIHIIAGCSMAAILCYIDIYLLNVVRWYEIGIMLVIGIIIYTGLLHLLREFNRTELFFLLDIINLKKLQIYLSNEIKKRE